MDNWSSNYIISLDDTSNTWTSNYIDKLDNWSSNYTDWKYTEVVLPHLEDYLGLTKSISMNNMHLYSEKGAVKKYNSWKDIMFEYYETRLNFYDMRRLYELKILKHDLDIIKFKVKFIKDIIKNKIVVNNRSKDNLNKQLEDFKYPKMNRDLDSKDINYSYLITMPIFNLTKEKIEELEKQEEFKKLEYDKLNKLSSEEIWLKELEELESDYNKWWKNELKDDVFELKSNGTKNKTKTNSKTKQTINKKK